MFIYILPGQKMRYNYYIYVHYKTFGNNYSVKCKTL